MTSIMPSCYRQHQYSTKVLEALKQMEVVFWKAIEVSSGLDKGELSTAAVSLCCVKRNADWTLHHSPAAGRGCVCGERTRRETQTNPGRTQRVPELSGTSVSNRRVRSPSVQTVDTFLL